MQITTFADGSREKSLVFVSNGARTVHVRIPRNAVVKRARLRLEGRELPDTKIIRVGIVKNCALEEFAALEEKLEKTSWGRSTMKLGWGAPRAEFIVGESPTYQAIPIDPSLMLSAHPAYYRREFDALIIPDGTLNVDLGPLISSNIPVVTMSDEVATKLGLSTMKTLHAALTALRTADNQHYITEQTEELLQFDEPKIVVNALAPAGESKAVVDTGIPTQAVIITANGKKYAYFGLPVITQILENEPLFTLFRRTLEWIAIGGHPTDISMEVGGEMLDWKLTGPLTTAEPPEFARAIMNYLEKGAEDEEPQLVPLTFHSASPGVLILSGLEIEVVFLKTITTFADGNDTKELSFDSLSSQVVYLELPVDAHVVRATLRMSGEFSNERIANRAIDTSDFYGVLVSPEYVVAQELKPDKTITLTRIALHIAKLESDTEALVELHPGHEGVPLPELLAVQTLTQNELSSNYKWVNVEFKDVVLSAGKQYWLVLNTRKGILNWHTDIKCPCGGGLRYSRDGGKSWRNHNMDALFVVYYRMESYAPSPTFAIGSNDIHWKYTGEFGGEQEIPDFSKYLNHYIATIRDEQTRPGNSSKLSASGMCRVPLVFFSESVGSLKLSGLKIVCELVTREAFPVEEEMESLLELIERMKKRVTALVEHLDKDYKDIVTKYKLR